MIDVTYGTYISEYTLAGLCMAAAFFLQHSLPVPADAVWLQSQGRFLVGGGWRSAQQKSVMLLHLAFFSIASGLSGLSRFVSAADDIDDPESLASIVVWRFALLSYSISGFGLARFCVWTLFSRNPPSPSASASTSGIVFAYYGFHVFSHNSSSPGTGPSTYAAARRPTLPQRPSPGPTPPPPAGPRGTQGYIPAWILVLFVGVASFARYRRGPTLLFVIAAVLFLTASFFTRPKEANVVTRQGWSESLPRQFNENAIFNACSILHSAVVDGGEKSTQRVALPAQAPGYSPVRQGHSGHEDEAEGGGTETR